MEDDNELIDLVDDKDRVIKVVKRTDYYKQEEKPDGYLRATELLIRNSKGKFWIPRRTDDRKIAPNGLDYSCGGHVTSGDNYLTSLVREIEEELNMKVDPKDLVFIKKFYPTEVSPWFRSLYLYESDKAPNYNRADFKAYYWLSQSELRDMLEAGEPAKSSMLETVISLSDQLPTQEIK